MNPYRAFLLLGLLSSLFVGIPDTIIAVYYVRVVGLGPLELVMLGTIVEVVGLLFEVPTGVVADTYSRRFGLALGFELAVVGYLAHMAFRSISGPLFTGWINRHVDSRVRATVLSMGGQVDAIGQLTGGPLIGVVAELSSLRAAMVAVGATLLPALPLLRRAQLQGKATVG